jgi:hypothetical protein
MHTTSDAPAVIARSITASRSASNAVSARWEWLSMKRTCVSGEWELPRARLALSALELRLPDLYRLIVARGAGARDAAVRERFAAPESVAVRGHLFSIQSSSGGAT